MRDGTKYVILYRGVQATRAGPIDITNRGSIETTRTLVAMLHAGTFRRYPNIKFIAAMVEVRCPCLRIDWNCLVWSLG